jgi:PAS domain S-box-containing protein
MKVLVAEDDPVSRRRLEGALISWGYDVVAVGDGSEALQVLERGWPEMAILDWEMPGLEGLEVVRRLRANPQAPPTFVILLTGRESEEDVVQGLEAGADEFLTKPFKHRELRARVQAGARVLQLQRNLAARVTELESAQQALAERNRLLRLAADIGAAVTQAGSLQQALGECARSLVCHAGLACVLIWTSESGQEQPQLVLQASAGLPIADRQERTVPGQAEAERMALQREPFVTDRAQEELETQDRDWARREGMVAFAGYPLQVEDRLMGVMAGFARKPLATAAQQALASAANQIALEIKRKRTEEEQQKLVFLIENSSDFIGLASLDGKVLHLNAAGRRLVGIESAEQVRQTNIDEYRHPSCPETFSQQALPTILAKGYWEGETLYRHFKTGKPIDVQVNSFLIREPSSGRPLSLAVIARDVTERKRMEMELRHAQKLEAVGGLAAGIAHEINTPIQFVGDNARFLQDAFASLTAVIERCQELQAAAEAGQVTSELLKATSEAAVAADLGYLLPEIPRALEQTLEGVNRVAKIVRAMKEFAHPDRAEKAASDLNKALESTLVVALNELKYVADVETDFGELPPVVCHPGDLNQVFLNILVNAAHAIGDVVRHSGQKGRIRITTRQDGDEVVIAISDTGPGIPEEIRDKIFDPFFTTKEVGKGTGQGLAIARSVVVDKHGGTLSFETEAGKGTTFFIRLPVSASPSREAVRT